MYCVCGARHSRGATCATLSIALVVFVLAVVPCVPLVFIRLRPTHRDFVLQKDNTQTKVFSLHITIVVQAHTFLFLFRPTGMFEDEKMWLPAV